MDETYLLEELEEELTDFKRASRYRKLSQVEWDELNRQMQYIGEITDGVSDIYASGEHYRLNIILRKFGFYPDSREQIMDIAWTLLLHREN